MASVREIDKNDDIYVGVRFPLDHSQEGFFYKTKTILEQAKSNMRNLLLTSKGERVMQPNLGVRLKRFLFEQFNADLVSQIQNVVTESINYWMPFLVIRNIDVWMDDDISGDYKHKMNIKVEFFINKDPSTHESV